MGVALGSSGAGCCVGSAAGGALVVERPMVLAFSSSGVSSAKLIVASVVGFGWSLLVALGASVGGAGSSRRMIGLCDWAGGRGVRAGLRWMGVCAARQVSHSSSSGPRVPPQAQVRWMVRAVVGGAGGAAGGDAAGGAGGFAAGGGGAAAAGGVAAGGAAGGDAAGGAGGVALVAAGVSRRMMCSAMASASCS